MKLLFGYIELLTASWESQGQGWTVLVCGERSVHGDSYLVIWRDDSAVQQAQLVLGAKHLELAVAVNVDARGKLSTFTLDSYL